MADCPQTEPAGDVVERVAKEVLADVELARTEVVRPANGARPYSYVTFAGARVDFHQLDSEITYHAGSPVYDAATGKAAAQAQRINGLLFDVAKRAAIAALSSTPVASGEVGRYDAGLLNDFGGGNVEWWWDYIRAELDRAHDYYASQFSTPTPDDVGKIVGDLRELYERILSGEFYSDYDEDGRLTGVLREHVERLERGDWRDTPSDQGWRDRYKALKVAATDAYYGWRYIREHHGDLYGVGWDRVEKALEAALAPADPRSPKGSVEHG